LSNDDLKQALEQAMQDANSEYILKTEFCDSCLGRLFGKVGTGALNSTRGELIRAIINKDKLEDSISCTMCKGLTSRFNDLADMVVETLGEWQSSSFLIGTKFDSEIMAAEEVIWVEADVSEAESLKAESNREIGKIVEQTTSKEVDFAKPDVVAIVDTMYESVAVQVSSLYIYGRYNKFSRKIPQTRWPCRKCQGKGCERCHDTGMMYPSSVEQIAGSHALTVTKGSDHRFHGMGREDIDALMLGAGRPFVLEVKEPKIRFIDFQELEEAINKSTEDIAVTGLRSSDNEEVVRIKNARPQKQYSVTIAFEEPVSEEKINEVVAFLGGKSIAQRTPTRVSHRRADKIRTRLIQEIQAEIRSPKEVLLTVVAEAGTYIKEFVHGDEGRTEPSIAGELGIECEVRTLDVLEILDENRGI